MNKIIFFAIGIFISMISLGQNTIKYVFPPLVEDTLVNYLSQVLAESDNTWLYLSKDKTDIYCISVIKSDKGMGKGTLKVDEWVRKSNRVAIVGEKYYKVLLDYDFSFASANDSVGEYKQREGVYSKIRLINEGFSIYFDIYGTLVKSLAEK
jgi:hypothetical protein